MDELTSVTSTPAPAAPPDSGQATPTSQPSTTPQPQSSDGGSSAPSTPAPVAPKINLFESQEFKAYQAQQSRTLSQYQQQLAEQQRQIDEARMASMDDLQQAQYRAERAEAELQRYAAEYEQQQRVYQYEQARMMKLQDYSTKLGIPVETLAQYQTPLELADFLADYHKAQVESLANTRAAELKARAEASKPDLGGGSLSNITDSAAREAYQSRDPVAYIRALRQSAG
jgi:hypothetical protein